MPLYLSLFFLQCPHLYICIVCMYICLNRIYLYLYIYCQCLMLTVCTRGLRVTQFQFSVCMCCTCGRIDNKADLTQCGHIDKLLKVKCLSDPQLSNPKGDSEETQSPSGDRNIERNLGLSEQTWCKIDQCTARCIRL